MKVRVLFVCLGNICRSPAAEGIMEQMVRHAGLSEMISVDSAGTYGGHAGEHADSRMRRAAAARGYNLTSLSRQIKTDDFDTSDMIIVMDDSNYERVSRLATDRESLHKIYRMTEFCTSHTYDHVPDPYYEGAQGFEIVLDLLEDACSGLLKEIVATRLSDDK